MIETNSGLKKKQAEGTLEAKEVKNHSMDYSKSIRELLVAYGWQY